MSFSTNPDDYLYLTSVEDRLYQNWQLELFIYSLTQMGRENKVDSCIIDPANICAVVHSEDDRLSKYFLEIVDKYGINYIRTRNFGKVNLVPYFKNTGTDVSFYKPKNKACCLGAVYAEGLHADYKYTMLTDSDVFAYEFLNVQKFPTRRTTIAEHWLCDHPVIDFYPNDKMCQVGVDLKYLMRSMHIPEEYVRNYVPGGCLLWLKTEDYSERLVNSIHGYVELIRSVCTTLEQPGNWCAEMPVYALGLAHSGIKAELMSEPEFCDSNCAYLLDGGKTIVPPGALPHYGYKTAWEGTDFTKWQYESQTPMDDLDRLKRCQETAAHPIGQAF